MTMNQVIPAKLIKKPFIPLEGLNRLTQEQLEEYYSAACAFLQVPPELGLLYFRNVDTGDAGSERMLVLKRGACEIIRQRLGISTVALDRQPDNPDFITYKAVGKDSTGRQEIAIGSQTTHNKFAKDFANADMAASTKALIRLTLQFAGGGFLWEGEIDAKIATSTDTGKSVSAQKKIAATPAPIVVPTAAPGKDVTTIVTNVKPVNDQTSVPKEPISATVENPAPAEIPAKKRTLRKKKEVAPPAPQPQVGDTIELPGGGTVTVAAVGATPATPVAPNAVISVGAAVAALDVPNAEELRGFRARNAEYSGVHFKKGNMQPLAGIGGNHQQLEAYWQKCIPNFVSGKQLSKNQWETVLTKLDEVRENQGVEGLVKHVQEAITGG